MPSSTPTSRTTRRVPLEVQQALLELLRQAARLGHERLERFGHVVVGRHHSSFAPISLASASTAPTDGLGVPSSKAG
ncbi:hypothetical protein AB0M36_22870 [Actinoplanes sp. NPDC051346]|uniref:hypothetical protein n=1 Tax=Actinoplanes sp. NPDC051346 TaxID=3155048 RepID=UPI0034298DD2